ncbi:TlpA disulfide reductase family protein [Robertkochia flava]|uniref:TlpA disulfide reductase family protein n=1 Tax=Robertkochia flava TaxID=3447986 RepID=UPI001CC9AA16|nr:TlpA disulfide reductase family protein [Robertkochia marina]
MKLIYQVWIMGLILLGSCALHAQVSGEVSGSSSTLEMEAAPRGMLTGEQVSIPVYDFEGLEGLLNRSDDKVYVVNFWATWCKPCVEELPYFEALHTKYATKDVEVVLVSLDFPSRAEKVLIPFVEKRGLKSTVLLLDDPKQNTWIPRVSPSWSGAIPATVIFSRDKREFYEKSFTFKELETAVTSFMN